MNEIKVGTSTFPLKASPLANHYYKQEFDSNMTRDFMETMTGFMAIFPETRGKSLSELGGIVPDVSSISLESLANADLDMSRVLQLAWAMAKAGARPADFPDFMTWVGTLDDVDVFGSDFLSPVLVAATEGLFGFKGGVAPPVTRRKRAS